MSSVLSSVSARRQGRPRGAATAPCRRSHGTVTIEDDFDGDGLGQWASYPPAQDVGYEPSLTPTADSMHPGAGR